MLLSLLLLLNVSSQHVLKSDITETSESQQLFRANPNQANQSEIVS